MSVSMDCRRGGDTAMRVDSYLKPERALHRIAEPSTLDLKRCSGATKAKIELGVSRTVCATVQLKSWEVKFRRGQIELRVWSVFQRKR